VRRYRLSQPWFAAAWIAAGVYAVVLSAATIVRHDHFRSGGYDLGIFSQAVWLMSRGHAPFSTIRGRNLFADHFQPALALLAPLGRLPMPSALLVLQAVLLAAPAPFLYRLARLHGARQELAFAVALLWLASPVTQWVNRFDYHPETAFPLLLVLGALFLEREQVGWFLASAVLAMSLKEDIPLVYAVWGLVLFFSGRRRLGAWLAGGATAWFVLAIAVAIPAWGGSLTFYSRRFAGNRGSSVGDVLVHVVEHPIATFDTAANGYNARILFALAVCSGGLAFLAPRFLALALPPLTANILSAYTYQHDLHFQYQLAPAAVFAVASAYGAGVLSLRWRPVVGRAAAAVLIGGAILVTAVASPALKELRRQAPSTAAAKRAALALVPAHAPVAASPDLVPHLALRRDVYQLPEPFDFLPSNGEYWSAAEVRRRADSVHYVIYDADRLDPFPTHLMAVLKPRLPRLGFHVLFAKDGVVLLARS
jgi:uncharacterized membrane protein